MKIFKIEKKSQSIQAITKQLSLIDSSPNYSNQLNRLSGGLHAFKYDNDNGDLTKAIIEVLNSPLSETKALKEDQTYQNEKKDWLRNILAVINQNHAFCLPRLPSTQMLKKKPDMMEVHYNLTQSWILHMIKNIDQEQHMQLRDDLRMLSDLNTYRLSWTKLNYYSDKRMDMMSKLWNTTVSIIQQRNICPHLHIQPIDINEVKSNLEMDTYSFLPDILRIWLAEIIRFVERHLPSVFQKPFGDYNSIIISDKMSDLVKDFHTENIPGEPSQSIFCIEYEKEEEGNFLGGFTQITV